MTAAGEVYVFGCGEHYQLGLGEKKSKHVPEALPLPLPTVAAGVFAGGDSSAVVLIEKRMKKVSISLITYTRTPTS